MHRTKNRYIQWLPFAATLILTIVTLVAYKLIQPERTALIMCR